MSEIVTAPVIKDERYEAFKDEVESTVAAYIHLDNENRKRFYWTLGDTIVTFVKENEVKSVTNLIRELSKDCAFRERSLFWAKEIRETYPTYKDLEAKNFRNITELKKSLMAPKTDTKPDLSRIANNLIEKYGLDDAKVIAGLIMATSDPLASL